MKKLFVRLLEGLTVVCVFLILSMILVVASGKKVNYTASTSNAISLQAMHFEAKYDDTNVEQLQVRSVSTMEEVSLYGATSPVSFVGQMTAYGPDCPGCGGTVSCPPRPIVANGNIYYQDETYGSVRILAADKRIPCGSIIEITNVSFTSEKLYGIVLDRGGAVQGNVIDLLVEREAEGYSIGRQKNVNYTVVRWGW